MSASTAQLSKNARIFVAGHRGMVGAALCKELASAGYSNVITRPRSELDLTDQSSVRQFFRDEKPQYVYLAAAKVGGIHANNTLPADFIYANLMMECNVINAAFETDVERLLFLGSSCIYPRLAEQPMSEDALLTGQLEPTNEPYALAKIAGIKLCESYNRQHGTDYRSVMPTNLYGPGDNFDLDTSHVASALLRKMHDAKLANQSSVEVWGTGTVRREFMYVEDMAKACLFVMELSPQIYQANTDEMQSHINVGTGVDVTIAELADTLAAVVGFDGQLSFNSSKPDGAPRKLLDVSRLAAMGWGSSTTLKQGLRKTYEWFLANQNNVRGR
ncbi:MAG: GDP-L-fucose synthase family protein [Gammaproteobacteria bacterium]